MISQDVTDISLLNEYGPLGLALGIIISLYFHQNKRIKDLEKKNDENNASQIKAYKELIREYTSLVEKNTDVISRLTICVDSFKVALGSVKETLQDLKRR